MASRKTTPKPEVDFPVVLSAHDLQKMGFSRTMSYSLLNMEGLPVIEIGDRKFMHRDLFMEWLADMASKHTKREQQTGGKAE